MAYIFKVETASKGKSKSFATEEAAKSYLLKHSSDREHLSVEKVPASYTLVCVDEDTFDFPTDFLGNFDSLEDAVDAIKGTMLEEASRWDDIDRFNEFPKFEVVLNENQTFVDYFDALTWYLEVSDDGQQVIAEPSED